MVSICMYIGIYIYMYTIYTNIYIGTYNMSKCHKKADWFINFNQKSLPDSKDGGVDEIDNSKQNFYIGQTLHYHIVWPFKAFQKQIQFSHVHRQQKTLDI